MLIFTKEAGQALRLFQNAVAGAVLMTTLSAGAAFAIPSVDYQFSQYTGNTNTVNVHVEGTSANMLTFTLTNVDPNPNTLSNTVGEFRAFYFNVADDSLLSGVVIAGADVGAYVINPGAVSQIPGSNDTKMDGGVCGTGCLFDVGLGFGLPGADNPLILSTSFTFSRAAGGLDISSFFDTTSYIMGTRMKPYLEGSSKDLCNPGTQNCSSSSSSSGSSGGPGGQEIPEPATLGLFGAALLGLGLMRRRGVRN